MVRAAESPAVPVARTRRALWRRGVPQTQTAYVGVAFAALIVVIWILAPVFMTPRNLLNNFASVSPIGSPTVVRGRFFWINTSPQRKNSGPSDWKRLGWLLRCGHDRAGGESPMLVMDRVRHAAILPSAMTARSGPKQCSQKSRKIVAGQPYLSRLGKR